MDVYFNSYLITAMNMKYSFVLQFDNKLICFQCNLRHKK